MRRGGVFILILIQILFTTYVSATAVDLDIRTDKHIYGAGKNISVFGSLYNTELGEYIAEATVEISLNGDILSLETDNTGRFNGIVTAPVSSGDYDLEARYSDDSGKIWKSVISIRVSSIEIDDIRIRPSRMNYYPGESMTVVIKPIIEKSGTSMGVQGVNIKGSIRNPDGTIYTQFSGETDAAGALVINMTAPQQVGEYTIEVNDFTAQKTFKVVEYDVILKIKDSSGQTQQSIFSTGQEAIIEVKVVTNGSVPKEGVYSFSGTISYPNGTLIKHIPKITLNQSNSYVGQYKFSIDSSFPSGTYVVKGRVEREGGTKASISTTFEVRTWVISLEKVRGFEFGYTSFPNMVVTFKITVNDRASGEEIVTLNESNFVIQLKSKAGVLISSHNTSYNSSLGYYPVDITTPLSPGYYILSVQVIYSGDSQRIEKVIKVTDTVAYGTPVDKQGQYKEVFDTSDYIYILLGAKNSTSAKKITNMELLRVVNEEGNAILYQEAGWSSDDPSVFEWRGNVSVNISGSTTAMLKLDSPKVGGLYRIEILVNNGTAIARTKFLIDPYKISIRAYKAPREEGDMPRYQFDTKDGIVFWLRVVRAKHSSGSAIRGMEKEFYVVPMPGESGLTGDAVANATITVVEIINDRSLREIPLSEVNITYSGVTNSNGEAEVTLVPASGVWDGGWYRVTFEIVGPDGVTADKAHGGFEARAFYLYAWSNEWTCQPQGNITFNVEMFDAGSEYWWRDKKGLSGTVSVEKILYHGTNGEWLWPPLEYDYPLDNPENNLKSISVQDGHGTFTLSAPNGGWSNGAYSFILKGTTADGELDYGIGWFEVRKWDVWASPIDSGDFSWRESFSLEENVTLYVNIYNAGSWKSGESLGGNLTIGIKKIEDYSSWPPRTLDSSEYTAHPIIVNESGNVWENPHNNHLLVIEPAGKWDPGHYSVVLDVNGTETGRGWFETVAFHAEAYMVDPNGKRIYSTSTGPLYFNITTSKDSEGNNPINTTVKEISLRTWDEVRRELVEFSYPGGLTVDKTDVPGKATIEVTNNNPGGWPSGWYHGEIVLEDSVGLTSTARVWFDIRPFRIRSWVTNKEVSVRSNVTLFLEVVDPSTGVPKYGNYSVLRIVDQQKYTEEELRYGPVNFTQNTTSRNVTITIPPPGGEWTSGYHSLVIYVQDDSGKRDHSWAGFRVVPFKVTIEQYKKVYKSGEDIVLNVTITDPVTGVPEKANVSGVVEWGMYSTIEHSFTPSAVEGNMNLTIAAPQGGWDEGYHDMMIIFSSDSAEVEKWIWFEIRSYYGYVDTVDENGGYVRGFMPNEMVFLELSVFLPESEWRDKANVTVTRVRYSLEYQDQYVDADWMVLNSTNNEINGTGIISLNRTEDWDLGEYRVEIMVSGDEGTASIHGYFRVTDDLTPPAVVIFAPVGPINSSSITINVTTNEESECNYYVHKIKTSEDYSVEGNLLSSDKINHIAELSGLYDGDYHLHIHCRDPSWNSASNTSEFSINAYEIEIIYYTDDLDDDGDSFDNNFYDADTGTDLGDLLNSWNTTLIRAVNGSLLSDSNGDGDLNDVDTGEDYPIYNGLYALDMGSSQTDVKLVYYLNNMNNLEGTVQNIRGTNYLITYSSTFDDQIDLGPSIERIINRTNSFEVYNAVIITGTRKLAAVSQIENNLSSDGKLYILDGYDVEGVVDISSSDYPSVPVDISKEVHSNSDAFDTYKVFMISRDADTVGIAVTEINQTMSIRDGATGVLGYSKVNVDNHDLAGSFGSGRVVFQSDNLTIFRDDRIDVPDTYYSITYTESKEIDIVRKRGVKFEEGTMLLNTNPLYAPIVDDTTGRIEFDLSLGDIKIEYGLDDLDDDGDALDNNFYDPNTGVNLGNLLTMSNASYIRGINGSLIFDGNADGDLKDVDDYVLYNGIFLNSMDPNLAEVSLVFYLNNMSNLTGTIQRIKGTNYLVTYSSRADDQINLGPSIDKTVDRQSIFDKDNAVTLTGTIKLAAVSPLDNDLTSDGRLYILEGTEVQGSVDVSSTKYPTLPADISNETHDVSDALDGYKVFMIDRNADSVRIAVTDMDQIITYLDGQYGAMGYDKVNIDYDDLAFGFGVNRVVFQSNVITVGRNDHEDIFDTYYRVEYTNNSEIDLKRRKSVTVDSGSTLKDTYSLYHEIVDDTTGLITVYVVPKG